MKGGLTLSIFGLVMFLLVLWGLYRSADPSAVFVPLADEEVVGLAEIMQAHQAGLGLLHRDDWSARRGLYQHTRMKLDALLAENELANSQTQPLDMAMRGD